MPAPRAFPAQVGPAFLAYTSHEVRKIAKSSGLNVRNASMCKFPCGSTFWEESD